MNAGPPARTSAEPRWHRRKEARPAEILDAAMHEFTERGFAAARLEDIARRAGCTKGTIFLYFANKEELFKAIVREHLIPVLHQAEQRLEQHEGRASDLLRELVRARWELMVVSRFSAVPKLVMSEAGNFPELAQFFYDDVVSRSHTLFSRVLRSGIERGEFRADLDVAYVTRALMAPLLVAALWKHGMRSCARAEIDPETYFATSLELLMAGLAAPSNGGGTR